MPTRVRPGQQRRRLPFSRPGGTLNEDPQRQVTKESAKFPFALRSFSRLWSSGKRQSWKGRHRCPRNLPLPLRVLQPEDRLVPAAVSWTGGAGTLNWGDAMNWSSGTVPGSGSDVTISISVSGTINLGAHAYAVRSLNDTSASLAIATGGSRSLAAGSRAIISCHANRSITSS
jgi:hypothetical protein